MKFIVYLFIFFCKMFIFFLYASYIEEALYLFGVILPVLIIVAYITVFERKMLSSMQRRRGPNVVGLWGSLQAFADAIKLLAKEPVIPTFSKRSFFRAAPVAALLLSVIIWSVVPFQFRAVLADVNVGVVLIFITSSLHAYTIIYAGWASNSKYAFLASLRGVAQIISYEISLGFIFMPVFMLSGNWTLSSIVRAQETILFFVPLHPSCILFFVIMLAECNRAPFDLAEAESELVSGFNVEYSALGFLLFFLSEYMNIAFMSAIFVIFFWGGWLPLFPFAWCYYIPGSVWFAFKVTVSVFAVIWMRSCLPRFRFDQLMDFGWYVILPLSAFYLYVTIVMFYLFGFVWIFPGSI